MSKSRTHVENQSSVEVAWDDVMDHLVVKLRQRWEAKHGPVVVESTVLDLPEEEQRLMWEKDPHAYVRRLPEYLRDFIEPALGP